MLSFRQNFAFISINMSQNNFLVLQNLAKLIRYFIIKSTTAAGSGHLTSSLSAVDLMTVLFFKGFFRFDAENPDYRNNDRLIFSKGHAAPLLYSLWTAAGKISEKELLTLRQFGSRLEGHPMPSFPFIEAATGSLGQGLSVGVGLALNAKYLDKLSYRTYVLLGDSEIAEGSVWEAIEIAAYYKLDNLIGIIDVNRLGQRGETMHGYNLRAYQKKLAAFGWNTIIVDGHNIQKICIAFEKAKKNKGRPLMLIAKTLKGKGVKLVENKKGWHGKVLNAAEAEKAIKKLGKIDAAWRGKISAPQAIKIKKTTLIIKPAVSALDFGNKFSVRKAYGLSLTEIYPKYPEIVALDAEVSNSTFAEIFKEKYPKRFFEMFIAEQNMVGVALGLARRGKIPFVSTFGAFFTRAFDQIRMSRYSNANIKFVGSHVGVSIGEDGPSQMGLEDIAMFRTVLNSVILYPADGWAMRRLVEKAAKHRGIVYLRSTRNETPIIYSAHDVFEIGGSRVLKSSGDDKITLIGAGITLFECLAAAEEMEQCGIKARVIDLYSIKPLDEKTLVKAALETKIIITVEDHFKEGGIGEAVAAVLSGKARVISLAVEKMPKSGKTAELLNYEEISKATIVKLVKSVV